MQFDECFKICVAPDINCFITYKENIAPSPVVVSLIDQDFDLGLKSPSNITKSG